MNFKKYLFQLIAYIVWIFIVIFIFRLVQPKQVAAVIAGMGFIVIPSISLFYELKSQHRNKLYIFALSVFIFFDALPIFITRLLNWGAEFEKLTILGIRAQNFHSVSNVLYTGVIFACLYCLYSKK